MIRGEGDDPAFAYTVGLFKSYGPPEIITLGLRLEVMKAMLNACGDRIRNGERLPVGTPFDGVLDDYPVALRAVCATDSYKRHVGYAPLAASSRPSPVYVSASGDTSDTGGLVPVSLVSPSPPGSRAQDG